MKRIAIAVAVLLATTAVNAQIYEWKDENGKTVYSDQPPSGKVRQQRKIDATAPAINTAPQKTTADREMDFRKRAQEAQEKSAKAEKEQADAAQKKENCEKSARYLNSLESGERIASRDDKGERYFMEDAQRQQEITKTRQAMQASCK